MAYSNKRRDPWPAIAALIDAAPEMRRTDQRLGQFLENAVRHADGASVFYVEDDALAAAITAYAALLARPTPTPPTEREE